MASVYAKMEVFRNAFIDRGLRFGYGSNDCTNLKYPPSIFHFLNMNSNRFHDNNIATLLKDASEFFLKYDSVIYVVSEQAWGQHLKEGRALVENMLKKTFRNIYTKIVIPKDITEVEAREDNDVTVAPDTFIYKIYLDREYIKKLLNPSETTASVCKNEILAKRKDKKDKQFYSTALCEALLNIGLITKYPNEFYLHKSSGARICTDDLKGNLFYVRVRENQSIAETIFNEVKFNAKTGEADGDMQLATSESWLLKQHFERIPYINDHDIIHAFCPSVGQTITNALNGIDKIKGALVIAENVAKLLKSIKEEQNLQDSDKNFGEAIILYDLRHYAEFGSANSTYWNVIRKYATMSNTENELDEIEESEE